MTPPARASLTITIQGTPVRYSKAVQLVHEFSGALLCVDVQDRAESEGFAMKVVLKTMEPPSGACFFVQSSICCPFHC